MKYKDKPMENSIAINQPGYVSTRIEGYWLVFARAAWLITALLAVGLFVASIPSYFAFLQTICTTASCATSSQLTPKNVQELQQLGLSPGFYAAYVVTSTFTWSLIWIIVAAVIFWYKSNERMALLVAFFLVTFVIAFNGDMLLTLPPDLHFLIQCLRYGGVVSFALVFSLFPNGQFVPRWVRWLVLMWMVGEIPDTFLRNSSSIVKILNQLWYPPLFTVFIIGFVIMQAYRYRSVSNAIERQQTKWAVFGFAIALLLFAVYILLGVILPSSILTNILANLVANTMLYLFLLCIPLSIGVSLFRYRLWDIDIIVNRTLVYGTLTACIIVINGLIVGIFSALFQQRANFVVSLLASGVTIVLFQPLRLRLQSAVDRLMYGERDNPYKVISRLGQRLEAALAPETVLPTIVETVAQSLKLPYAAIVLTEEKEAKMVAVYGKAQEEVAHLPLTYQAEPVGELLLAPRAPGEAFTPADRALLTDLARQAGISVHTVQLTADLQRLTAELQHSQTQLVTTREEERRRLRRDLHDGLGSVLASLNMQTGAIRALLTSDLPAADALLLEQQQTIRSAIGDIRRLVYELRPPSLDELGLVGALRERAAQYNAQRGLAGGRDGAEGLHGLRVDVSASDLPPALPAAVEVAVYRIVQEALANVARHARAHSCQIDLVQEDGQLHVEITDDGIGLPASYSPGIGLRSMRERARELGGNFEVFSRPEGGTLVCVCLPIAKEE